RRAAELAQGDGGTGPRRRRGRLSMGVRERLAGALDRRDEAPNIALAEEIAASGDSGQLAELAELVRNGAPRQRTDAMKVFYEIGRRRPDLIAPQCPVFLEALQAGSKRELWG